MANLAQINLGAKAQEAQIRALLEDLTDTYLGVRTEGWLALAVWFEKSLADPEQHLLYLFIGPLNGTSSTRVPLYWKSGTSGSPFVSIEMIDVVRFTHLLKAQPDEAARYLNNYEVLYFDKAYLTPEILDSFHVVTEPPGLMKGWYISEEEYANSKNTQELLSPRSRTKPETGLVKTQESSDFENCRGIFHAEFSQKWLPLSPDGIRVYTYWNEFQRGRPVYFLFEGGALFQVLRFEVKTAPAYVDRFGLLEKTPNDRYPEVYLRAVRPPAQTST